MCSHTLRNDTLIIVILNVFLKEIFIGSVKHGILNAFFIISNEFIWRITK